MIKETNNQFSLGEILIIDDNISDLKFIAEVLSQAGYKTRSASDGELALRSLQVKCPDFILMDLHLPDIDGVELCKILKEDPATKLIPIIFISAEKKTDLKVMAMEKGAVDYITKPIQSAELLMRIATHLRIHRDQKQLEIEVQKRTTELTKRNVQLKTELTKRIYIEIQLKERLKELNCLYGISDIVETANITRDERFQRIINSIPPAYQYPEITCARILINDQEFKTENFKETIWKQTSAIILQNEQQGILEVYYLHEKPEIDEGPFLKEERDLIDEITDRLCKMIEQIKVEDELRILETAMEQSPVSIVITDTNGKIEYVNRKFCELTGYSNIEVLGKNPRILQSGEISKENYNQLWQTILTGKEWHGEFHNKKKSGDLYWEDAVISPIINEKGKIAHLLAVKEDITKRKQAEEEKAILQEQVNHQSKMEAIGQLAGGMAHDFNNVLSGIMGAAQLLKSPQRSLDEKSNKYVDLIMQASIRAADLTSKLLAFGRKGKIASISVNLHDVVNETVAILYRTIDKKISIKVEKGAENHKVVGDSSGLQNALLNLVINACHAMFDGGTIQIETKNIKLNKSYCDVSSFDIEPGEYCQIEVRDSGCGIPVENLKKIFEPFYTTKEQGKGTGLGLSAVYGTVQDHHGAINVYSEVGKGTSFHILLPCSERNAFLLQKNEEVLSGSGVILLIDDEEFIRITGQDMLESMGYKVLLAENGQKALEIFQKHHREIDLVIMDMIMPVMNGRETFIKLKEIDKSCKIIVSSGFSKNEDVDELRTYGLSGFIRKPYRDYELSQLLVEILRAK